MTDRVIEREQFGSALLQQRSDERAFFGQKRVGADQERVIAGAVFNAVCCQNGCAHCERARRLRAA